MPYFSPKINPDALVNTKINTLTFYKEIGGGGGAGDNSPQKPKTCKNGSFSFFTSKLHARRVDDV